MQVADAGCGGAAVGGRIAERDVDEVLHLVGRRPPAVGPETDHALGALDVVEQVAQPLHQAAAAELRILAIDDLVADVQRAELLEHARLTLQRLTLEPLPRRLLGALLRLAPGGRLAPELAGLGDQLVPLAEQPVDHRERRDDHARQIGFLLLGELFLVDVDDLLDGDVVTAKLLAQLTESLDGEVRAEDGGRDLVLAFFDALGERDLALAREERDRAPSRAGRGVPGPRCVRPGPA